MAIRIVRHPSRGHLAPRKVNVVTGKLAAFRDWDDWKYTLGKLPPRYPMPAIPSDPPCLFCGSTDGYCKMHPQRCLEGKLISEPKLWNYLHD